MAERMEQQPEGDILEAVQSGDIATAKKFVDEGVPVDLTDEEGWSLLHHAAALGQVEVINLLREKGCRVDLIDNEGRTPLHYAATNGNIETIRLLIAMGSNVNSVDNESNTPLKWSVMCEQNAAIEELIKHGGTVEIEEMEPSADNLDRPALLFPSQHPGHILEDGNNEVCRSKQTDLSTDIQHVSTAVKSNDSYKHSDHNSRQTDLVTTNQCIDTNADTTQLEGDIFEAAQCGDTAAVKGYLDLGVPVDVTDEDSWSPVHHAIAHRQVEVIRLLMDRGCLMNPVKNKKHLSKEEQVTHTSKATIFKAIAHCQMEVIRLLMDRGCLMNPVKNIKQTTKGSDLRITTEGGSKYSPCKDKLSYEDVFTAARCGDTATIQSYLNSGGPVDLTDKDGRTLLHCAAGEGQIKVVELLIKRGCRIDPVDKNECTPLDYATACGHVQTVQLLKQQLNLPREEQYSTHSADNQGRSALHFAAASGKIQLIESILLAQQGLDVNIGDDQGLTPLHDAATYGHLESVLTLLRLGGRESMTKVAGTGGTPLHQAVAKGHKDIVSLLLNEGCPINVVDSESRSVLHFAAQGGQIHMIEMFAEQGLDVNIVDDDGLTPLHYAVAFGHLESVCTLLRSGGRESMTKVAGTRGTPLHQAVAKGHKDIVSLLLNEGCPINVVNSEDRSVLHFAAQGGQIHMIEMLAEQGLDVNKGDDEGWTPLHNAAVCCQLESVRTLLMLGGRESMTKIAGTCGTPLHQAVAKGHKNIVSLLLNEGCPINVVDSGGRSVLHFAAQYGQIHIMKRLVEQGLDVNIEDAEGLTPLHRAATYGQLESLRTLLRLGGRESMTKVAGAPGTPLHQAVAEGHKDIVSLLLNEGCPINVVDSGGRSVLHYAARYGQIHMIEMLTEQGLNVNIDDDEGLTPLHSAVTYGQLESVCTLLRLGGRESMTRAAGIYGTPLHQAVGKGHKDIVTLLLNEGCPINVVDNGGTSVLHFAAQGGQIHMIEMLAERGLDVNIGDAECWTPLHNAAICCQLESVFTLLWLGGRESMIKVAGTRGTPLHQAVGKGHKDIASLLLNEGCPINVVNSEGRSVLHFAAQYGQIHMIEMLAEQGLNVNIDDDEGLTPLHSAVTYGQLQSVRTLLRFGGRESMTKVASTGGTPLHQAVGKGHKDIVSLLLNEGCPINVVDSEGGSVLHYAVRYGQIHMIEMLAERGLDANIGDNEGWTPFHIAAACGQLESVRTLLRSGGRESMSRVASRYGTPLHQAVAKGHKDIVSLLLNEGCPINVVDSGGRSVLHYAAQNGQIYMIEMLAEQGFDVNIGDDEGGTPLHNAAAYGQLESVFTLLWLGGRESMTKVAGILGTPLHQAVRKGHKDIASLLLNEGCPINVVNSEGENVLHIAARCGQIHILEMLAEQGLDVNIGDNEGWTPLHDAAANGQLESVRTLLRLGGRESMTKIAGICGTPLHQAVAKGHKDIVSLLLNEGCPINVVDSESRSVLHRAAQCDQIHMIEMLAEQGLDVNISDDEGWTPLHVAAAYGQLESMHTLLRLGGRESMTKIAGICGTPLHPAVAEGHKDMVSLLLNEGCPINEVGSEGRTLSHWTAAFGCSDMIEMLSEQGLDVNIGDNNGLTSLHHAALRGHVTTFKELISAGGNMHLMDKFGMKFSDLILICQSFVTVKQLCVACGLQCKDKSLLGVLSALSANNLLDMNRILCLAAVAGNISIFDAMVTSSFPLDHQKMPKMATCLSSEFMSGGKKLPDQFHVSEEPLNPLHISILSKFVFSFLQNTKFIEKLTSHPRTRYTVNELFPNGLSPLDVARRFEFHDIAVIIERAGGGQGAWADLPKEIEDRAIDRFTTLKELRRGLGEDVISRIVSLLGYPLVISDQQEVKRILKEKPKRSLMQKHVLSSLKYKRKWERVGDLLEVDEEILEKIGEEFPDADDAYYSMLKHWLKHGRNVSWKTLLDAVGHFETKKTVDHITDKIVEELAPSQERTESSPDPQCGAIIEKHKVKFLSCIDARAIVTRLETEEVIPDTVSYKIENSAPSVANEVLFLHLRSHSSPETLHKLCDVMISMRGYAKMKNLGKIMKDNLPTNPKEPTTDR